MVGQFKKAYLHRPIKILHFLTPSRIQKCLTYLQNICAYNKDFLTYYSCSYYSSMVEVKHRTVAHGNNLPSDDFEQPSATNEERRHLLLPPY